MIYVFLKKLNPHILTKGGKELHHSDNDGSQVLIYTCSSCLEDGDGEEYDSIDSGPLLEEHETEGDDKREDNRSLDERRRCHLLVIICFSRTRGRILLEC